MHIFCLEQVSFVLKESLPHNNQARTLIQTCACCHLANRLPLLCHFGPLADWAAEAPRNAASDHPAALAELQLTGFGLVL